MHGGLLGRLPVKAAHPARTPNEFHHLPSHNLCTSLWAHCLCTGPTQNVGFAAVFFIFFFNPNEETYYVYIVHITNVCCKKSGHVWAALPDLQLHLSVLVISSSLTCAQCCHQWPIIILISPIEETKHSCNIFNSWDLFFHSEQIHIHQQLLTNMCIQLCIYVHWKKQYDHCLCTQAVILHMCCPVYGCLLPPHKDTACVGGSVRVC